VVYCKTFTVTLHTNKSVAKCAVTAPVCMYVGLCRDHLNYCLLGFCDICDLEVTVTYNISVNEFDKRPQEVVHRRLWLDPVFHFRCISSAPGNFSYGNFC